ncbi:DNA topoisomerase I [compost metagenome]
MIEQKLKAWGKWQPTNKKVKAVTAPTQHANVSSSVPNSDSRDSVICQCGAPMVKRKNKSGVTFFGCSKYPQCKHTKAIS